MGPMPTGLAGQYITVMMQSHYFYFVAAVQVVGGALLLIGRYIPLGLTLLGPVIVNIIIYHLLMELKGIPMAIIVTILWAIVFYRNRQYFSGVFAQKTA
jgi:putative oxidoreductase